MEANEIIEQRHDMLEELLFELKDGGITARFLDGASSWILTAEMADVVMDGMTNEVSFFFAPITVDEESGMQTFCTQITITDRLAPENLGELMAAVSYINCALPAGAFAIDKEAKKLIYRYCGVLPHPLEDIRLRSLAELCMEKAYACAGVYGQRLLEVNIGEREAEDIVEE